MQLADDHGASTGPRTMSACAAPPALKKLPRLPLLGSSWPRPGVMVPFVSVRQLINQVSKGGIHLYAVQSKCALCK